MSNENNMGDLLGEALHDVQEDGIMGAGKKLAGNLIGNFLSGLTGGGNANGDEESEDEDSEEEPSDSDDSAVVNDSAGSYEQSQVASKRRDHDVDDDIDGYEDDTSAEQNLA